MKRNLTLVLELALGRGSISLWKEEKLVGIVRPDSKAVRSEDALVHIDRLLSRHGYQPIDIERVICSKGPGGYTGIRIGLATAHGLKRALGIEIYGYTTTEALLSLSLPGKKSAAVVDAGRKQFHMCLETGQGLEKRVAGLDELPRVIQENNLESVIASVTRIEDLVSELSLNSIDVINASDNVNEAMFRLFRLSPGKGRDLSPEYGREFKAFGGR